VKKKSDKIDKPYNAKVKFVNPQDLLVESLEGIHLVDAGAGTGKTHTIIRRYNKLIDSSVKPEAILLITFTNVAATQMKEEVISKVTSKDVSITQLLEAPVMTFHALCTRLLKKAGGDAPKFMGVKDLLSTNFSLLDGGVFERELFRNFFTIFSARNSGKHENIARSLNMDDSSLLIIIKRLCSAGIFPSESGWIEDGEERLRGDFQTFIRMTAEENIQEANRQTAALTALKSCKNEMPAEVCVDDFTDGKKLDMEKLPEIFYDDAQKELIEFVREVYIGYVKFLIRRNQINFEFLVMLAYLKLVNDDTFRENAQYEYVMVDEFQDTDKIQFKLLLLLCKNMNGQANLTVVGDWRQGIYGFRNTTIENITEFQKNIDVHAQQINIKSQKLAFASGAEYIKKIAFEYNYRSSQKILDFSRNALFIKATKKEKASFNYEEINFPETLKAQRDIGELTEVEFMQSALKEEDDEIRMIVEKIRELVSEEKYQTLEFDNAGNIKDKRRVRYSDIAVLSRTRDFCIKLQKDAAKRGVPISYDGGFEIFASKQGILVLAWLKLMLNPSDISAIVPILENEGYDYGQIRAIIKNVEKNEMWLPEAVSKFVSELYGEKDNLIYAIEKINGRYGFRDEFSKAIIEAVSGWMETGIISLGETVSLIESSIKDYFNIELSKTPDSVTCRTIHSSKGLEYPVIILGNINRSNFPSSRGDAAAITYNDIAGLRMKKQYSEVNGYTGLFDNWKTKFVNAMSKEESYSESRRLLYVALTRAKQYLYLTSYNPSVFFTELAEKTGLQIRMDYKYEGQSLYETETVSKPVMITSPLPVEKSEESISVKRYVKKYLESDEYSNSIGNSFSGMEYGTEIHLAAYRHAMGIGFKSESKGDERVKQFIDGLKAERLEAEVDFSLPKDGKLLRGAIDLLAHYNDRILVVDYKTDMDKSRHESYVEQVRLYIDAVKKLYSDKQVSGVIYYVGLDEQIRLG
jgi:superfamily I DNA/RNA helicase